ncbi:unnamed protein product [Linum tenue]|uniref:Glycosyltransferase n=1 Tax=Linum tenue TaxID=586396 RepID=A0AAV0QMR1_9ROSI|nr:unnamed protein product [Linum tenue]
MAAEAVVFYPSPAIGHLISMVELGRLILTHRPSLSVHIILPPAPYQADATAPYIAAVSASTPSIAFHRLPPPPATAVFPNSPHHEMLMIETLRLTLPHLRRKLQQIVSESAAVHGLIVDFFNTAALSVAAELEIPCYNFFTSGAACLAFFLHFPTLHGSHTESFGDLGRTTILEIPGAPKLPASEVPKILLDRNDDVYRCFLEFTTRWPEFAGLIVNTFDALESEAVRAISAGLCVPDLPTPPLYCIGPLIGDGGARKEGGGAGSGADCLAWLDSQPKQSVVFLSFGSLGVFSREQLREIAIGLERSGQRFLWVVRDPPSGEDTRGNADVLLKDPELSLEGLLPDGFLERTEGRGYVVKSWAPQVEVLGHESVGGFVTHCGWNSVLEAIRAGVPMVAWPLYAEQNFNRVLLVEEIRIALPMVERNDGSGFVEAAEVERCVKELMEIEGSGELVRRSMVEMKNAAEDALRNDSGSSRVGLVRLVDSLMHQRVRDSGKP